MTRSRGWLNCKNMRTIKDILKSPTLTSDLFVRGIAWCVLVAGLLLSGQSVISAIPTSQLRTAYMLGLDTLIIFLLSKFRHKSFIQDIVDFASYETGFLAIYLGADIAGSPLSNWCNENFRYVTSSCFILTIVRLVWFFPNKSGDQTINWPIIGICGARSRHRRSLPESERTHRWVVLAVIPLCLCLAVASTLVTFGWPAFSFAIVGITLVAAYADQVNNGLEETITERNSAVEANHQFEAMLQNQAAAIESRDAAIEELKERLTQEMDAQSYTRDQAIAFIDRKITDPERRLLTNFALLDPRMHDTLIDFVVKFSRQPVPPDEPPRPTLSLVQGGRDS